MKIYYAASIWGVPSDVNFNKDILNYLKKYGSVLSEHLFTEKYQNKLHLSMSEIHDRDLAWVRECDKMVADLSNPSLGVGYEIREGVIQCKPILGLWKLQEGKNLSAMIAGSPGVNVHPYRTNEEAKKWIDKFFA